MRFKEFKEASKGDLYEIIGENSYSCFRIGEKVIFISVRQDGNVGTFKRAIPLKSDVHNHTQEQYMSDVKAI